MHARYRVPSLYSCIVYHDKHGLVLQQSTDAGEEADEHDASADCDEDVSLSVVWRHFFMFEDQMPTQLVVPSYPHAKREDRATY